MAKNVKLRSRNPLHDHPLLSKGGAHQKASKAIRQRDKTSLKKEWLPHEMVNSGGGQAGGKGNANSSLTVRA